ncbi:hypothetical protein CsSME_00032371 [Camellia sinensis var. sinensis]
MDGLITKVAFGSSTTKTKTKFATGEAKITGSQQLYCSVQCTPDITENAYFDITLTATSGDWIIAPSPSSLPATFCFHKKHNRASCSLTAIFREEEKNISNIHHHYYFGSHFGDSSCHLPWQLFDNEESQVFRGGYRK